MTTYTDTELEELLADTESDLAERKESLGGDVPAKAREAICAFANDLPDHRRGGVLFIGARDDGTPSGQAITDEMLRQLADMKTDGNILPPPTMTVQKRTLLGSEMAVVIVEPADSPPVSYRGRIWIRIGPRRGIATQQDERILNEKRRAKDRPFDVSPVKQATLEDLDLRFFDEVYLVSAVAPDLLEANERSREQRLAAAKFIISAEDPVPTVLGILVLGKNPRDFIPGAYVQFLRIAGSALDDPISDQQEIDGNIYSLLSRVDEKTASHNRRALEFRDSLRDRVTYAYPPTAIQQIVRNAILHRTYEHTNAPVKFYWFDDRIEIISPGGPFGAITAATFGKPGLTDYRNRSLAEALKILGFVQRFGVGIPSAQSELQKAGHPPLVIEVVENYVSITIQARP